MATLHLNKINELYGSESPWNVTFSYGRALQADALKAWNGSNRDDGQRELLKRAEQNSMATFGKLNM